MLKESDLNFAQFFHRHDSGSKEWRWVDKLQSSIPRAQTAAFTRLD